MKAGSLRPDDELGALRESASSPSSGEVCLEVCSEHCFSLPSSVFYHSHKEAQRHVHQIQISLPAPQIIPSLGYSQNHLAVAGGYEVEALGKAAHPPATARWF